MEGYNLRLEHVTLKKIFMNPFYGWGSTASRLEQLGTFLEYPS